MNHRRRTSGWILCRDSGRICPICQKKSDDWLCAESADGKGAICYRVQSSKRQPGGGFYHRLNSAADRENISMIEFKPKPPKPKLTGEELASLQIQHLMNMNADDRKRLSVAQGVSEATIRAIGCGQWLNPYSGKNVWTIPQRDLNGELCGFRTMTQDGTREKRAIFGSRAGAFFSRNHITPEIIKQMGFILVCEGFTDQMIAFDMGIVTAIGRSNCVGEHSQITDLVDDVRPELVVIVADNDQPGRDGADDLELEILWRDSNIVVDVWDWTDADDLKDFCKTQEDRMEFINLLKERVSDVRRK
ncbi:MAG: hypothetical protein GY818_05025 [Planctomycetaceae bacterium]|nr:hypothetical protein [Planctomycetaceae bacterium]